jgi:glutathione reductase (NADPH)
MNDTFDVLVIGSGVAGGVAARALRKAGKSVAVIDDRPFGGTCPLRGCEPKKVFHDVVEARNRALSAFGHGLSGEVRIDWPAMQRFKRSFTDPVPGSVEKGFSDLGIHIVHARARFAGPATLALSDGGMLEGRKIVIATGAMPRALSIPGAEHMLTSDDFLELDRAPERILFVGGGYISFEFAHVAARAGSRVEIIQRGGKCLKHFDPDLVDLLCAASHSAGITVHYKAQVYSIARRGTVFEVRAGEDGSKRFEADLVVHGAGRVAAVDDLAPERGEVRADSRGIIVDDHLQSVSNPDVYAAGDVTAQGLQLTSVAVMEGEVVAHNIIHGNERRIDRRGVPVALFTHPVLATVGSRESELLEQSSPFEKKYRDTSGWSAYRRVGEGASAAKVLIDPGRRTILGAHLLGHGSEEVINLFGLAIRHRITVDTLMDTAWAYPSFGYSLMRHMLS